MSEALNQARHEMQRVLRAKREFTCYLARRIAFPRQTQRPALIATQCINDALIGLTQNAPLLSIPNYGFRAQTFS